MGRELKPARGAGGGVAAGGEVAVAVRVASAGGDVRRVEDVAVDDAEFVEEGLVEFWVPLFDVFAPEVHAFEEFRAALLGGVGGERGGEGFVEGGGGGGG